MSTFHNLLVQLQINQSLFYMMGIFAFSYLVLSNLGIKKLSRHLVERDQRIEGREHEVHHIKEKLSENHKELAEALKKAQLEASTVFGTIRQKAVEEQRGVVNKAREESSAELKKVRASVNEQMTQEMKKLEGEIPKLARLVLDQIMDVKGPSKNAQGSVRTEV